ncbi:MAG: polyhydroxyalkanoate synthesis regulator DNA-binding domain-containing protein [Alphaproteobacteria bacterium]|nr:polyhydroxyalkanoate synthesis regulator DNA-binding domain-containing protein [Alphaproteobacteria bacterium]
MITIKKYGNRRLYDGSRSRYINLEELAAILRSGEDVEIVDAKTGEDLSREVLLQVFMEVLKGSEFFPTSMLRRIIRISGDDPVSRMLRQQMAAGFELMHQQMDRVEAMLGGGKGPFAGGKNPFAGGFAAGKSPFAGAWPAWAAPGATESPPEPEPEEEEAAQPEEELDELRARLAALEERLGE